MFYGITDPATFLLGTIIIVLLPGPNSLYVMTLASQHGIASAYRGAAGIFAGDSVLMILSVTGAASLLHTSPLLFIALKYAGAAYLAWLGLSLLKASANIWRGLDTLPADQPDSAMPRPFRTALMISLTNPKAILFFVSFFVQFVSPDYAYPALSFLLLGATVQVCSALYLTGLIFGGARLARLVGRRRRLSAVANVAVGSLFIGFSIKLASATLA